MGIVYLNGQYQDVKQATVSVLDRAFLYGDAVYEVIPVYAAQPFRLTQHLQRLHYSLSQIGMTAQLEVLNESLLSEVISEVITRNGGGYQSIYVQISRGVVAERKHSYDETLTPTVFVMSRARPILSEKQYSPVKVITETDIRWARCDIKSTSLIANVLLNQLAHRQGCEETLLMRDGAVIEGASSNVFVVKDEQVFTPPKTHEILSGVTRQLLLEIAARQELLIHEQVVDEAMLRQADEVWISSSSRGVLPVIALDGKKVGTGNPGAIYQRIIRWYCEFMQAFVAQAESGGR